jgi:hypothetical protein
MFFGIGVECENPAAAFVCIQHELDMAGIERDVAVRMAEAVSFAVIVVAVIADAAARAVEVGEIGIKIVAAESVGGAEGERPVLPRPVSDEVQGATGLRAVKKRRAAAQKLQAIHCIQRRRVIRLGITKLVGMNGDAVLQDLRELHAARVQPAIADTDQRRCFLA